MEGSLCRLRLEGGGGLEGDWGHHRSRTVTTVGVVELEAPLGHDLLGMVGVGELVPGQYLPLQGGEENASGGGVVETRPDPPIDWRILLLRHSVVNESAV